MRTATSQQEYFELALDVLADLGFECVNIGALCHQLGVTSGSFYHHFQGWDDFVRRMLSYWEEDQAASLRDLGFGHGDPAADVRRLRELTLGLNHRAETALRAWGANDSIVHAARSRVDESRRRTLSRTLCRFIGDEARAETLAALGMAMLMGYQQRLDVDDIALQVLLDHYLVLAGNP